MFRKSFASAMTFGLANSIAIDDNTLEINTLSELSNTSETLAAQSTQSYIVTPINHWMQVTNGDLKGRCKIDDPDIEWAENKVGYKNTQDYMDYAEQHGYDGFAMITTSAWDQPNEDPPKLY